MNELIDEWMNEWMIIVFQMTKKNDIKKKQTKIFQALVVFAALVSGKSLSSD